MITSAFEVIASSHGVSATIVLVEVDTTTLSAAVVVTVSGAVDFGIIEIYWLTTGFIASLTCFFSAPE